MSTIKRTLLALALLTLLAAGCNDDASTDGDAPALPDRVLGDYPRDDSGVDLQPPGEGEGIQLVMQAEIEAGIEIEHCRFIQLDRALLLNHDELRFGAGSHHVLVYQTAYDEIPIENERGEEVDTSATFPCPMGAQDGWLVEKLIAGSQNSRGDSLLHFPPDVAMPVADGTVVMINAHYINATDAVIYPEVRVNLHTIPEDEMAEIGDLMFWFNVLIEVPTAGQGKARMRCPIDQDITLINAQSHMHKRGVGYEALLIEPDGEESVLYETEGWDDVVARRFDDGLAIEAGSVIDFTCLYENTGDTPIYQGTTVDDEMCMFIASYYPADRTLSQCSVDDDSPTWLGAEWIGNGEASCSEVLLCVNDSAGGETQLQDATTCVMKGAPEHSMLISDTARCIIPTLVVPEGEEPLDPLTECADEISACLSGTPQ